MNSAAARHTSFDAPPNPPCGDPDFLALIQHNVDRARRLGASKGLSDSIFVLAKTLCGLRDAYGLDAVCAAVRELDAVELCDLQRFRIKLIEAWPWGQDPDLCRVHQATARAKLFPHRWGDELADQRRKGARRLAALYEILAWSGDGTVTWSAAGLAHLLGTSPRCVKRWRQKLVELGLLEALEVPPGATARYRWTRARHPEEGAPGRLAETSWPEFGPQSVTPLPLSIEGNGIPHSRAAAPAPRKTPDPAPSSDPEISIPTLNGTYTVDSDQLARWKARWADRDVEAILQDARSKARTRTIVDPVAWCISFLERDFKHHYPGPRTVQNVLPFPTPQEASPPDSVAQTILRQDELESLATNLDDPQRDQLRRHLTALSSSRLDPERLLLLLDYLEARFFDAGVLDPALEAHLLRAEEDLAAEQLTTHRYQAARAELMRTYQQLLSSDPVRAQRLAVELKRLPRLDNGSDSMERVARRATELVDEYRS